MTTATTYKTNTVIIGAGPAGIAMAACLSKKNVPYILLEQSDKVATKWHNHYKRLHLHTAKEFSSLPYLKFPKQFPRYPSRQQVVRYLEDYAAHFNIKPKFQQTVVSAKKQQNQWIVEAIDTKNTDNTQANNHTQANKTAETIKSRYECDHLVVATGFNHQPNCPTWKGMDTFTGEVLHSDAYIDGNRFKDKTVMVVGFGNSGSEIAIDLWEYGAKPIMSVRSPVNVLPKEIMGIPTLAMGILQQHLPAKLADTMSQTTARTMIGDLSKYGLKTLDRGPMEEIQKNQRVPMLDIGTIDLIKQGKVLVYPDIDKFAENSVTFVDGRTVSVDAVLLATGFRPKIAEFLDAPDCLHNGFPTTSGQASQAKGLYFIGFYISPAGMFYEMANEAKKLSKLIAKKRKKSA